MGAPTIWKTSTLLVVFAASSDALRPALRASGTARPTASVPFGVRAAAALGTTASVLLPRQALAAEDGGWALPALPDWLAPPQLLDGKEVHELIIFLAKTVISWGVPAAAIGALAFLLAGFGKSSKDGSPPPLPPALAKALGMTNEPKEYLEIERLNEKLQSFEFSFQKASVSSASALRKKTKADIERQLGAEFSSFGLDALTTNKVFAAASKYRSEEEKVTKRLEATLTQLRAMTLTPTIPGPAAASGKDVSGKVVPTVATAAAAAVAAPETSVALERSLVDKIMYGARGQPASDAAPPATAGASAAPSFGLPFGGGAGGPMLRPLMNEKAALEQQQTQLELDFLRQLSTILTADQVTLSEGFVAGGRSPSLSPSPCLTRALTATHRRR